MKKKSIVLVLALALLVVGIVGGTLAWLTAESGTVTNTFTTSGIKIELNETGMTNNANSYKMVPGYDISKDPKVTVETGSEKCYLFVKLEKSANFDSYLTYGIAKGWEQLKDKDNNPIANVFVRIVDTEDMGTPISVLADDKVTVKGSVTSIMMENAKNIVPTLKVTAYASQFNKNATESFTATQAWANIFSSSGN